MNIAVSSMVSDLSGAEALFLAWRRIGWVDRPFGAFPILPAL
jgi:hypothetical protein